jgi:hypothetical protein
VLGYGLEVQGSGAAVTAGPQLCAEQAATRPLKISCSYSWVWCWVCGLGDVYLTSGLDWAVVVATPRGINIVTIYSYYINSPLATLYLLAWGA